MLWVIFGEEGKREKDFCGQYNELVNRDQFFYEAFCGSSKDKRNPSRQTMSFNVA